MSQQKSRLIDFDLGSSAVVAKVVCIVASQMHPSIYIKFYARQLPESPPIQCRIQQETAIKT